MSVVYSANPVPLQGIIQNEQEKRDRHEKTCRHAMDIGYVSHQGREDSAPHNGHHDK